MVQSTIANELTTKGLNMGSSWQTLLDELVYVRDAEYRNDIDREDAIKAMMLSVMQTMLEMLRDGRGQQ